MYFYILPGPFRTGFGITSNYERREKDYTGAWGGTAQFAYLWQGPTPHVKRLENIIKTQYKDMLWQIDEWETEWLDNGQSPAEFSRLILELITDRHLPLKQIR